MNYKPKEIAPILALLLITTAAFLIIVLLYPHEKPGIKKKVPVTIESAAKEEIICNTFALASLKIDRKDLAEWQIPANNYYLFTVMFSDTVITMDTLNVLTIYDPTITVVWDTTGYKQ